MTVPMSDPMEKLRFGTELVKRGFARMQQGGVIMDVTTADQAAIAEEAGAVAVMALERVPADIRAAGGVARMADPLKIREIQDRVSIPVMAKCRIGHTAEARVLEALAVDMIDESEVLTPADPFHHVDKKAFQIPFVCGARNLGEALRRIEEGAAMIRTKGEAGTGNVVEAVRHIHQITGEVALVRKLSQKAVGAWARKEHVSDRRGQRGPIPGATSRGEFRRRWHRDPLGRGALSDARCRRPVRRQRDFQIAAPDEGRPRDRGGVHPLRPARGRRPSVDGARGADEGRGHRNPRHGRAVAVP